MKRTDKTLPLFPDRPAGGHHWGPRPPAELGKERALGRLAIHRRAEIRIAQIALLEWLLALPAGGSATVEIVYPAFGPELQAKPAHWLGAAAKALATRRVIGRDGYAPGKRPESHGRPLTTWKLLSVERAERELKRLRAEAGALAGSAG